MIQVQKIDSVRILSTQKANVTITFGQDSTWAFQTTYASQVPLRLKKCSSKINLGQSILEKRAQFVSHR